MVNVQPFNDVSRSAKSYLADERIVKSLHVEKFLTFA